MANEAVILSLGEGQGRVRRFTCAAATSISGGTICQLTDPITASASSAAGQAFAGIAAADKDGSDSSTSIGLYTEGTFDLVASGAITVGAPVFISGANLIATSISGGEIASLVSGGLVLGRALETASNAEVIAVAVGIY
jgi:hypothetical protein